ncbi:MAG: ABC transporter ATP-binding protein, partial [Proteobacteria bacterium]|nr:ABC transporter ATP-binding protein [Pseudomonadota bacterium]
MLAIQDLHAWYGKSHVLQGVNLQVGEGEIVSLLGRNGAGRSTTVKAAMGQVAARGSIVFRNEEILGMQSFRIARKGLGYVPESRDVFPGLSVEQNLLLGQKDGKPGRWTLADMYRLFPQLDKRRAAPAGVLSGGEQQMLSLCRTLMGDPTLMMVDEPTEGLAPMLVESVARCLCELRERGVAVLLAEQKLAIALKISQRVYVMGRGKIMFEGTPEELAADAAIRKEWL